MFPANPYESYVFGDLIFGLDAIIDMYAENSKNFSGVLQQKIQLGYSDFSLDAYAPLQWGDAFTAPPRQYAFWGSITRHPKYASLFDDLEKENLSNVEFGMVLGRKCKAALNWAKEDNIRVHFLLDHIDMNAVVKKSTFHTAKPITGRELRWVYRNRDDEGVQNVIQFWKGGRRTQPPWVSNKLLWDTYLPKSTRCDFVNETIAARTAKLAAKINKSGHDADDLMGSFFDFI
ncbi:hypothetical protein [Pseudochrobactrum sp. MP213Fo]|uniref:hypothetical protein n=1 Tax=Pseudochrobactrum sp. MP213Fo TaxID=3022250 RepID=UPI003BA04DDB